MERTLTRDKGTNLKMSGLWMRVVLLEALPSKGFAQKGKACHGGKSSKVRLTVAFFVNASGDKEKPVVVWKSAKPRGFKGITS